jgi:hypothetical protein
MGTPGSADCTMAATSLHDAIFESTGICSAAVLLGLVRAHREQVLRAAQRRSSSRRPKCSPSSRDSSGTVTYFSGSMIEQPTMVADELAEGVVRSV